MTESTSPVRTSPGDHSARRTRWKTPAGDLSVLAIPELGRLGECAANNAAMFAQVRCADSAAPLVAPCPEERREARRAVLVAAQDWTRDFLGATSVDCRHARVGEAGEPTDESAKELLDSGEWYLTGHQPALFHPGVWVKNFVVAELARRRNGVGLNLIVDNDTAAPPTIMLPAGDPQAPHFTTVPYDVPHATGPWEEAGVVNRSVFDQFGESALRALSQFSPVLIEESVLPAFWDNVVRARQKLLNPAWAFSAARAALERQFGWGNLELPLSRLCELDCFRRFVGRVLADLPRLHAIYNSVLADYRRINRLRSKTHPVPDLRRDQEWLEAPFW
ncbi:MAG: hypothetical protein NT069_07590, partial [Planctomycetota bacterium]|nr:hypothetical protein [Planctomycetota bacterium]